LKQGFRLQSPVGGCGVVSVSRNSAKAPSASVSRHTVAGVRPLSGAAVMAPALAALSQQQARWVAWINPPFIPYAPALQAVGIDINRILLIHPRSHEDLLWALERAAKSGGCSCVLAWPDEKKLKLKDTQRLQLASKQGRSLTCLFRPRAAHQHASMAELRLALKNAPPGEIRLDIVKRRGGWPLQDVRLQAADVRESGHAGNAQIREQLALWRSTHRWQALKPAADPAQPMEKMSGSVSGDAPGGVSGEIPLHTGRRQPESAVPVH